MHLGGNPLDIALVNRAVDKADFLREHLVEKQTTDGRIHHLSINAYHDRLV